MHVEVFYREYTEVRIEVITSYLQYSAIINNVLEFHFFLILSFHFCHPVKLIQPAYKVQFCMYSNIDMTKQYLLFIYAMFFISNTIIFVFKNIFNVIKLLNS